MSETTKQNGTERPYKKLDDYLPAWYFQQAMGHLIWCNRMNCKLCELFLALEVAR